MLEEMKLVMDGYKIHRRAICTRTFDGTAIKFRTSFSFGNENDGKRVLDVILRDNFTDHYQSRSYIDIGTCKTIQFDISDFWL